MTETERLLEQCNECGACVSVCGFLQHYCDDSPKEIAKPLKRNVLENTDIPFSCSLCGLCQTVCKHDLSPGDMCLQAREAVFRPTPEQQIPNDFVYDFVIKNHRAVRNHQIASTSPAFTFRSTRKKPCKTLFFPGCSLSAYSPKLVTKTFDYLKEQLPDAGIMLDCCGKPSKDTGDQQRFQQMLGTLSDNFSELGVEEIVVACSNCYSVFAKHTDLKVTTIYEIMSSNGLPASAVIAGSDQNANRDTNHPLPILAAGSAGRPSITIHDSCPARNAPSIRHAVRDIARQLGLHVDELKFKNKTTQCCGAGGCAALGNTALADKNTKARAEQADSLMVSYCAHCRERFSSYVPSLHILDLVFGTGYKQPTREYQDGWQNWLNRWTLKIKLHLKGA